MSRHHIPARRVAWILTLILVASAAVSLLASGCSPETPEAATRKFFKAITDSNWNTYLDSILPERVREMTDVDMQNMREGFKEGTEKFSDLKMNAEYDKKNKNRAKVTITSGKITRKDPLTGKTDTTTMEELKEQFGETPSVDTEKYKGRWYVDVKLATEVEEPIE